MRILHTSDWHAGRIWKGLNRLDELERCLEQMARYVESEGVDLVLMTGDVFDSGAPSAEAERAVFRFFKRVGAAGAQTVVIAGNHDSGARLEAWSLLAELVGVRALGRPRKAADGGLMELRTAAGETAQVAAVPFAAPRTLVSALELADDESRSLQSYAERMGRLVQSLTRRYRSDAVRLLCLHTHLEGAVKSGSERQVHVNEDWAATPAGLPADAHYIALGHIHKPQEVRSSPSPAFYAGSPLQLDFGEAGEQKSFVVIDVQPGTQPARFQRVPYEGGKELRRERMTLEQLTAAAERLKGSGWLRVTVPLESADPEMNRKVRELLGASALAVDVELPREKGEQELRPSLELEGPRKVFEHYYRRRHEREAPEALLEAFEALRKEVEGF